MFKIEKLGHFEWPVKVHVPKDGGGTQVREFTGIFQMHKQSEMDDMVDQLRRSRGDEEDSTGEGDLPLLRKLLVGWKSVKASDDSDLEFSEANRDALLDIPYVRTAVLKAYFEAASGNKVKKGNS